MKSIDPQMMQQLLDAFVNAPDAASRAEAHKALQEYQETHGEGLVVIKELPE